MSVIARFGLVSVASVFLPSMVVAQAALTCGDITGYNMPSVGSNFDVSLDAGDQVTVTAGSGSSAYSVEVGSTVLQCGFIYGGASCAGHVFTAPVNGTYTFEKTGGIIADTLTCAAGSGGGSTGGGGTGGSTSTTSTSTQQTAQSTGAAATAAASTGAIANAIGSAIGSQSSGGAVTRDGIFLTTQGGASMPSAWVSLQARGFSGDLKGRSYELTFGADMEIGRNTRLGVVVSGGRSDLDYKSVEVTSEALTVGPYFQTDLNDRSRLTGHLLFARPNYEVGSTSYRAERSAIGLAYATDFVMGSTDIVSTFGLSGFRENHPSSGALSSRTISQTIGSVNVRANFASGSDLRPYFSIGANFSRFDDGSDESSFVAPRVGLGFEWQGDAGSLSFDVDGGRLLEETNDVGATLKYSLDF